MPKPVSLSPRESSALAAARRALAAGRLAEVARRYEDAARAREAAGESPLRHRRRALDFWVEAGETGRGLACARSLLRARLTGAERGAVGLAVARLHLLAGHARKAALHFARARRLLGRDRERARQAALGEAQARVEGGEVVAARRILERCRSDSRKAGDSWAAATALLRLGQLELRAQDPWAAREVLEEARSLSEARHLLSVEAESTAALAEAELALGRAEPALRHAEHAAHVLREMERDVEADRLLALEGAALAARYEALDPSLRDTAGPALRRQALQRLARARRRAVRDRDRELERLLSAARRKLDRKRPPPPPSPIEEAEPRARGLGRVLAARSAEQASRRPRHFLLGPEPHPAPRSVEALPRLRPGERLVVLHVLGEEIEAWVADDHDGLRARIALGAAATWRDAASALDRQVHDAAGWPDSVVPEHLVNESRRALERLGATTWTPLLPALAGGSHVIVVPDPALPSLPWAGLLLASPPAAWPRPRSVSLLPATSLARPPAWKLAPRQTLALAERTTDQPLAEREARAVARVLGGSWKAVSASAPLLDVLRPARLHHWASTIVAARPAELSRLPDGETGTPLWRLARAGIHPQLVVVPRIEAEGTSRIEVARIVGRVGPEGARRAPPADRALPPQAFPDADAFARALLAGGAARALVNGWPFEAPASAGLVGSFYAGLARGDAPAEALFTAQRRAFDEGLHPAAWAGFALWGWP